MKTAFVEATQNAETGMNYGKFMVGEWEPGEWNRKETLPGTVGTSLLIARGWHLQQIIVFDLETCEGAGFSVGGSPKADLDKHKIWVCPMFEPFLVWLYEWVETKNEEGVDWLGTLPKVVELPEAEPAMFGYRREGK